MFFKVRVEQTSSLIVKDQEIGTGIHDRETKISNNTINFMYL